MSRKAKAEEIKPTETAIVPKIPRRGWCGESEAESYEAIIESIQVDEIFKNSIRRRYIQLIKEFHARAFHFSVLYHVGHLIITVGSLTVPALLSVQYTDSLLQYQTYVYWLTWAISLLVTTFNGILVLFKVDKKYHYIHTALERLRSEGWQYLELPGRYAGHLLQNGEEANHKNQYRFFCHYVEKIKLSQVEDEYYKYDDTNNPVNNTPNQKPGVKDAGITLPSINEDIAGLKPPQSVQEVMKGLITETNSRNEVVVPITPK